MIFKINISILFAMCCSFLAYGQHYQTIPVQFYASSINIPKHKFSKIFLFQIQENRSLIQPQDLKIELRNANFEIDLNRQEIRVKEDETYLHGTIFIDFNQRKYAFIPIEINRNKDIEKLYFILNEKSLFNYFVMEITAPIEYLKKEKHQGCVDGGVDNIKSRQNMNSKYNQVLSYQPSMLFVEYKKEIR